MQGNVNETDLVITKTGLKGAHFKHMHINKEAPMGQHYAESFYLSQEIRMTESFSEVPTQ